jgi:hypothetical protein
MSVVPVIVPSNVCVPAGVADFCSNLPLMGEEGQKKKKRPR